MNTLATSHLFYTHGFETILIIAILFTLIGLLVGWLAWRNSRFQADRVERRNRALNEKYQLLRQSKK